MEFDTYEEPEVIEGDRLEAKSMALSHTPMLVFVAEYREGLRSSFSPEPKDGVFVDVLNLATGAVFVHVLWMGSAVVDRLKLFVGKAMGIELQYTQPKGQGQAYIKPVKLEGDWAERAKQWALGDPTLFERTRNERGIPPAFATQQANTGLQPISQNGNGNGQYAQPPTPQQAPQPPQPPQQQAPTPPAPPQQQAPQPPAPPQQQAPQPPQPQYQQPPAPPQPQQQAQPPAPQAPPQPQYQQPPTPPQPAQQAPPQPPQPAQQQAPQPPQPPAQQEPQFAPVQPPQPGAPQPPAPPNQLAEEIPF